MTLNHKSHELLSSSLGASWSHLGIWALQTNQWITSEPQGWDAVSIFQAAQWFQALAKFENPHRVSFLILLSSVNRHQPSLTLPGQKKNVAFFLSRKFWKGYIISTEHLGYDVEIWIVFYLYSNFLCPWWGHFYLLKVHRGPRCPEHSSFAFDHLGRADEGRKGD